MIGASALAVVPFPVAGEHPAGWLRRLAVANGFETMRQLRCITGIGTLSARSGPGARRRLVHGTGIDAATAARLNWRDVNGPKDRWLAIEGVAIRLRDLDMETLRHCPACVEEGRPLPAANSVRLHAACPRHRLRLRDACGRCGRPARLDDLGGAWRCGGCDAPLADGPRIGADADEIAIARVVERTMDATIAGAGRPPPSPLAGLSPGMTIAVLDHLADIAMSFVHDRPDARRGVDGDAEGARRASRLLRRWPHGLRGFAPKLTRPWRPGDGGGLAARLDTPGGRLALSPIVDEHGVGRTIVADEIARALESSAPAFRRRAPGASAIATAAVDGSANGRPISHAAAMQRLEGRPDDRLARWWIEARILREFRAGDGAATLRERDVDRAERRLMAGVAPNPLAVERDLRWVDRSIAAGRAYGKARFLRDVLAGRIACRVVGDGGLGDMVFDGGDVDRLRGAATIADWKRRDHHAQLSAYNIAARLAWGEAGVLAMDDCDALAAAGRTTPRRYDPPTEGARPQKRWRVADLAALSIRRAGGGGGLLARPRVVPSRGEGEAHES